MESKSIIRKKRIDERFVMRQVSSLRKGYGVRLLYNRLFLDILDVVLATGFERYKIEITIQEGVMDISPITLKE